MIGQIEARLNDPLPDDQRDAPEGINSTHPAKTEEKGVI
jgi:hypothetical protein